MDAAERERLKTQRIEDVPRRLNFGPHPDLAVHDAKLRTEFAGLPALCHHHATLITRIRRRIDLVRHVPAFLALWDAEAAFLAEHSPTKWLVAACDTFFDHGPAARRGPALCLSVFISTLQLAESERRTLADVAVSPAKYRALMETHAQGAHVELWDGVRLYNFETGDRAHLMLDRVAQAIAGDPVLEPIGRALVARALGHDTLLARLARYRDDFLPPSFSGRPARSLPPAYVGAHAGHGFVHFRGRFHAFPHALGPVDLETADPATLPGAIVADTLLDAMAAAERAEAAAAPPVLVETVGAANIVRYRGRYLVVPHAAGALDLATVELAAVPGLRVADTLAAARHVAETLSSPKV